MRSYRYPLIKVLACKTSIISRREIHQPLQEMDGTMLRLQEGQRPGFATSPGFIGY